MWLVFVTDHGSSWIQSIICVLLILWCYIAPSVFRVRCFSVRPSDSSSFIFEFSCSSLLSRFSWFCRFRRLLVSFNGSFLHRSCFCQLLHSIWNVWSHSTCADRLWFFVYEGFLSLAASLCPTSESSVLMLWFLNLVFLQPVSSFLQFICQSSLILLVQFRLCCHDWLHSSSFCKLFPPFLGTFLDAKVTGTSFV